MFYFSSFIKSQTPRSLLSHFTLATKGVSQRSANSKLFSFNFARENGDVSLGMTLVGAGSGEWEQGLWCH